MSHSVLHGRQKHISKYQALLCERVTNNQQHFSGAASQNLKCHTEAFHYSWMLCSFMPTSLSNGSSTPSSGTPSPPCAHPRILSDQRRHECPCVCWRIHSVEVAQCPAPQAPGKGPWTANFLHNRGPGDLSLGQGNGHWEKRQELTTPRLPCT